MALPLHAVVAGASGMIGRALVSEFRAAGWSVTVLVRRPARSTEEVEWDPGVNPLDPSIVSGATVVVNLAGSTIARMPWTRAVRREIVTSRRVTTQTLVESINKAETTPHAFLCASAVGFYGNQGEELISENGSRGEGFLADVVAQWESDARQARCRTVYLRTGLVIGSGGALRPLRTATEFFLGARIGRGSQWWPWISLHDEVRAILHLAQSTLHGPVNLVGPTPATAEMTTRFLSRELGRPHWFAIPAWAIGLLGDAGRELLLWSQKVTPAALTQDGFQFDDTTVDAAIHRVIQEKNPQ